MIPTLLSEDAIPLSIICQSVLLNSNVTWDSCFQNNPKYQESPCAMDLRSSAIRYEIFLSKTNQKSPRSLASSRKENLTLYCRQHTVYLAKR